MYIQFISNLKFVSTFKKLKITKICIFWDSLWNFLIYICQLIDWNDYTRPQLQMLKLHISKQNGRCNDVSKIMNFWIIFFSIHISLPTTVLCYRIMLEYIWHTSFLGFSSLFFFCVCVFRCFFPIFFSFRRRVFCSWFFFLTNNNNNWL